MVSLNTLIQIVLCFIIIICASGAVLSHAAIRAQALRRHHPKMWGRRRPGGCDGGHPGCPKNREKLFLGPVQALFGTILGIFWVVVVFIFFDCFFFFAFLGLKMKKKRSFSVQNGKKSFFLPKTGRKISKKTKKSEKWRKQYSKKSKRKLICFRKKIETESENFQKKSKKIESNTRKDAI